MWQENGGPLENADCSGQLGLAQRAQPAGKMGRGREANLYGLGISDLMKVGGEVT